MEETSVIGFIDDESDKLMNLEQSLIKNSKCQAFISQTPEDAIRWVHEKKLTLLASDFNLHPKFSGMDLLEKVRQIDTELPLVLFTYTYGVFDSSVEDKCRELNITCLDKKDGEDNLTNNIVAEVEKAISKQNKKQSNKKPPLITNNGGMSDIINYLREELITHLKKIEDQDGIINLPSSKTITIAELITEVETLSPIGEQYIKYWMKVKLRLKKLDLD